MWRALSGIGWKSVWCGGWVSPAYMAWEGVQIVCPSDKMSAGGKVCKAVVRSCAVQCGAVRCWWRMMLGGGRCPYSRHCKVGSQAMVVDAPWVLAGYPFLDLVV